jgi:hypothetical protein
LYRDGHDSWAFVVAREHEIAAGSFSIDLLLVMLMLLLLKCNINSEVFFGIRLRK